VERRDCRDRQCGDPAVVPSVFLIVFIDPSVG
jgi:hypothetical protein